MWTRGDISREASLVPCLCNSLGLALVCAAMKGSSLFPSLMPGNLFLLSHGGWEGGGWGCGFWQTDPHKHYFVVKSLCMGVSPRADQCDTSPYGFVRKICEIPAFWYPVGETGEKALHTTPLLPATPLAGTRGVRSAARRIHVSDPEPARWGCSRVG